MPPLLHRQNQSLVDAHTETLQKVIEEYDKKVREPCTIAALRLHRGSFSAAMSTIDLAPVKTIFVRKDGSLACTAETVATAESLCTTYFTTANNRATAKVNGRTRHDVLFFQEAIVSHTMVLHNNYTNSRYSFFSVSSEGNDRDSTGYHGLLIPVSFFDRDSRGYDRDPAVPFFGHIFVTDSF